ncbi:MAG TPA: hypothetical protein VEC36_09355, partial [Patescibacteria group bacterium]|nr:hypothetical protein [Patescibacteria group bacterium]
MDWRTATGFLKMLSIMKKPYFIALGLMFSTALLRLAVADFEFGNLTFDSGNFALAVRDYSVQHDRPHLPGYILYVVFLKVLSSITASPGIAASILFSSLSSSVFFWLFKKWFSSGCALIITLFILVNPMAWFSGATAEIYSFELLFSGLLVLAGTSHRWIY